MCLVFTKKVEAHPIALKDIRWSKAGDCCICAYRDDYNSFLNMKVEFGCCTFVAVLNHICIKPRPPLAILRWQGAWMELELNVEVWSTRNKPISEPTVKHRFPIDCTGREPATSLREAEEYVISFWRGKFKIRCEEFLCSKYRVEVTYYVSRCSSKQHILPSLETPNIRLFYC